MSPPPLPTSSSNLTTFTVKVDGTALPGTVGLLSIDISRELNRIPTAEIVLYDGDAAEQDFAHSSSELLRPGKSIAIEGGYSRANQVLFKGCLTGLRIQARQNGESTLRVSARHPAFRMALDRKSAYFKDLSESDLFEQLIGAYADLKSEVVDNPQGSASVKRPEIVQYQVSDWDFLLARAEVLGMYCQARDDLLRITAPDLNQETALRLTYGQSVFELELDLDARTQVQKVSASAWDYANQELIVTEVDDAAAPDQGNLDGANLAEVGAVASYALRHSGALKQPQVDAWAQAAMLKSRFARIRGTLRVQGTGAVEPGDLVELGGLGERFNGKAYVSAVRHALGGGDWQTTIQLGLRPAWHSQSYPVSAPPAAAFAPALNGLQIGVVTQLQDDPDGEDRIRLRLPMVSDSDEGTWARLASLDAGEKRGAFFRPEIGDEVLVGFLHGDPNHPVVLGMLHSSSKPAPLSASDDNHEKGFVTRSGMKLIFNDETPSLTIETPAGNQVLIDDKEKSILLKDAAGNQVKLSQDGIALESQKDIVLKASGDVKIDSLNLQLKAKAAASLEGSSGATLKSGGSTEVKGSLVQIN